MRYIDKGVTTHYQLDRSNTTPPTTKGAAETRWSRFSHKDSLSGQLKEEQLSLCAYSEIRLDDVTSGTHIEHVEPKSDNPHRTFDYTNLVLSALSSDDLKGRVKDDIFGGHARTKPNDLMKFISSRQSDCSHYFRYLSDGRIVPEKSLSANEKNKATYTITELNLNCSYLQTQRKGWIEELDELIDKHITSGDSLADLASIYLVPTSEKLYSFFSASKQRFGSIGDEVLK